LDLAKIAVSGLITGSRVKISKVSDGTVLFNVPEVSGSILVETDYIGAVYVEARKASVAPFYQPWLTQTTTVAETTVSVIALQQLDE
jgi:hypothetical protein